MKIAMTAAREQFPLSPMKVTKKTIIGTFGFLVWLLMVYAITWVALIFGTGKFAFPLTTLGFVGVVPIIIVLRLSLSTLVFRRVLLRSESGLPGNPQRDDHFSGNYGPIRTLPGCLRGSGHFG